MGILGFVLGLPPVSDVVFGKKIGLDLNVVSQIPVFAVQQPVPGLSVTFNSQDLTQARQDVIAARVRLQNTGDLSINAKNTTPVDPLGFQVRGGRVVKLTGITATSNHLRTLAVPRRAGASFFLPPGLIIDPGDYIQFDMLILKPVDGRIDFIGRGKVEGLKAITTTSSSASPIPSVFSTAWSGSLIVHLLRIVTYPFVALALIAVVVVTSVMTSNWNDRRKRQVRDKYARIAKPSLEAEDPKLGKLVPLLYASIGRRRLEQLSSEDPFPDAIHRRLRMASSVKAERDIQPLSDFEASDLIDEVLEENNVGVRGINNLLARLSVADPRKKQVDPTFAEAISKFLLALEEAIDGSKIERAEPSSLEEPIGDIMRIEMQLANSDRN